MTSIERRELKIKLAEVRALGPAGRREYAQAVRAGWHHADALRNGRAADRILVSLAKYATR